MPPRANRATLFHPDEEIEMSSPTPERPISEQHKLGHLTADLSGRVLSPGSGLVTARIQLRYDSTDPYAVHMTVRLPGGQPIPWTFGRELLDDGLSGTSGAGDVTVAPCPQSLSVLLHVTLRDDVSAAVLEIEVAPIKEFLLLTHGLVPPGCEGLFLRVEDDVSSIPC
jgi:hypothetical protein